MQDQQLNQLENYQAIVSREQDEFIYNYKQKLDVQAFSDIDKNFINENILVCSKKNSGKSVLCLNIIVSLYKQNKIHQLIVFSNTASFNEQFSFCKREQIFHSSLIDEYIPIILQHQRENIKKKQNIIILYDDVNISKQSKNLSDLCSQNRHFFITNIISVQYNKLFCSSSIRQNLDSFFFNSLNMQSLECLYQCIFTTMTFKQFISFVNRNNGNFQFLLYDTKQQDQQQIFKVIKADNLKIQINKKTKLSLESKNK